MKNNFVSHFHCLLRYYRTSHANTLLITILLQCAYLPLAKQRENLSAVCQRLSRDKFIAYRRDLRLPEIDEQTCSS